MNDEREKQVETETSCYCRRSFNYNFDRNEPLKFRGMFRNDVSRVLSITNAAKLRIYN